jgi:hypothetical protein
MVRMRARWFCERGCPALPATARCRVQFLHAHDGARAIGNMGCSGGCVGGCGMALSVAAVSVVVVGTGGSGGVFFSSLQSCEASPAEAV